MAKSYFDISMFDPKKGPQGDHFKTREAAQKFIDKLNKNLEADGSELRAFINETTWDN